MYFRRATYYGDRIDEFVKESAALDLRLNPLGMSERFQPGPDFFDALNDLYFDITTELSWPAHVRKYGLGGKLRGVHIPSGR